MEITFTVPDKLSEIKLRQYKNFLTSTKGLKVNDYNIKMVENLCGIPHVTVMRMRQIDINDTVNDLTALLNETPPFKHRFMIDDLEFGMIPSLEDMTAGEYADLTYNISDWETMHKAMAVLFRPITERVGKDKYDIMEYDGAMEYALVMDEMPLDIAMGALVFFWSLTNELLNNIQHSIQQEVKQAILQGRNSSVKSGAGINISIHSLEESLQNLMKCQDAESMKPLLF